MVNWKASLKATAVGAVAGAAIGLIAFFLLASHQYPGMGATLFLLVPVAAGFSIVLVARQPNSAAAAALLSVLCSLVFLVALGKKGCCARFWHSRSLLQGWLSALGSEYCFASS